MLGWGHKLNRTVQSGCHCCVDKAIWDLLLQDFVRSSCTDYYNCCDKPFPIGRAYRAAHC